jgi:hypothetical protein
LTIRLHVQRLSRDGFNFQAHELGEEVFRARLNERAIPAAEFSEPAYAYLIAFNPAEKAADLEQLIPKKSGQSPPALNEDRQLNPKLQIPLTDGEGLQAFAVVASRRPLPPYAEWRQRQPPLPWKRTPAKSGVVLRNDGKGTYEIFGTGVRRGPEEPVADVEAIDALAAWLKTSPDVEAVAVMGFAVDPPE